MSNDNIIYTINLISNYTYSIDLTKTHLPLICDISGNIFIDSKTQNLKSHFSKSLMDQQPTNI